jgi:tol-pal system protein YbgF
MRRIGLSLLLLSPLFLSAGTAVADNSTPSVQSGADAQCFQALQGRLDDLSKRMSRLEDQANSQGVLSLLNQLESMEAELARLRGAQDELAHQQQIADKRQKDVMADFDQRLKDATDLAARPANGQAGLAVTTGPAVTAPSAGSSDPESEAKTYEAALNQVKAKDYKGAVPALNSFLKQYPGASLAGNAAYWLGFSYYAQGDYKNAQVAYQRLLKDYPQHAKAPDAMIGLARADIQLGEVDKANQLLDQVMAKYPGTSSAETAQKMQALLK